MTVRVQQVLDEELARVHAAPSVAYLQHLRDHQDDRALLMRAIEHPPAIGPSVGFWSRLQAAVEEDG